MFSVTKSLVTLIIVNVNIKLTGWLNEGALIRKIIVGIGLILLVAGIAFFVFPAQESYFETITVKKWNLQSRTLAPQNSPQNSTFYGTYMEPGSWFQLNISSSSSVKVTASVVKHEDTKPIKIPFFEQTGNSFNQKLPASGGTNFIDIKNENPFSVTLQGNVLVQKREENYRTIYPYVIPGFLIILGGTSALILGIFKRPQRLRRSKVHLKRKIKSR